MLVFVVVDIVLLCDVVFFCKIVV